MIDSPQLCLGTVQFGLPYGVTNQQGQVPEDEVSRILQLAASAGIDLLDTAQSYGTAERVVGRCWPTGVPRRLISKLPGGEPRSCWESRLMNSLNQLQTAKLDGFLLHRPSDLFSYEGAALLDWLESLRDRGLVDRIGVSIYEASDLECLPLDRLQLVQLPLSVYDQRLIHDGTVHRLQDLGIAVHVRSVLLQGLLLRSPQYWPQHLSPEFRNHHSRWLEHLHQCALSPLAGALGFVRACGGVEAVLCGVLSENELSEVLYSWHEVECSDFPSQDSWAWENPLDLDPRRWPPR